MVTEQASGRDARNHGTCLCCFLSNDIVSHQHAQGQQAASYATLCLPAHPTTCSMTSTRRHANPTGNGHEKQVSSHCEANRTGTTPAACRQEATRANIVLQAHRALHGQRVSGFLCAS